MFFCVPIGCRAQLDDGDLGPTWNRVGFLLLDRGEVMALSGQFGRLAMVIVPGWLICLCGIGKYIWAGGESCYVCCPLEVTRRAGP